MLRKLEIRDIEYQMRKMERGVRILYGQRRPAREILRYAKGWGELKERLRELAGREEPSIEEWPV